MGISSFFIQRPVATTLFMVAILLSGTFAYLQLSVSALPEIDYPTIQIFTFYPGANPEVMATAVTAPLERQLGQVPGLQQMTSISSDGSSVITLQFDLSLNIDVAEQEVQQSINAAGTLLPADLPNPPIYSKTNPADAPILTLALTSDTLPLSKLEDIADSRLAQKISQLSGVGLVSLNGGHKPAVRIQLNPLSLAAYGLNFEDVRTAISSANVNIAKGSFDGPSQGYQIGANDQLVSAKEYHDLIIDYRNNSPVRLSDVANIVDGTENSQQAAWMAISPATSDTPTIIMNIQRQPGANIISVVDSIKKLLPKLQQTLPPGIKLEFLTDRTTTIRASVADVEMETLLAIGLVIAVIFLFLRSFAATFIPAVAVPLSLVGTFGLMYMLGFSLNNLTLMALTISTGFVVDDAIVMIENIFRYIEEGYSPMEAAFKGSAEIGFTILSLTISLIAVLIPLLFMGDIVGRLFREFAITLSITILFSAVVSLTLTPMMCSRILAAKNAEKHGRLFRVSESIFTGIISTYAFTLRQVLKAQTVTLLVAAATFVLTIYLYIQIPKGLFPVQDTGVILGITQGAQSISFEKMSERQREITSLILQDPAVASVSSFVGVDGTNTTLNSGRIQINLKPLEQRDYLTASQIIQRLSPKLTAIPDFTLYMQPVQDLTIEDRVSRTQYQYTIEDSNPAELSAFIPTFLAKLQARSELRDVASDQLDNGLRTSLVVDRDTASRLGLSAASIDNVLYDAFGQRQVSTIFTEVNQYHVIMEMDPSFAQTPGGLDHLFIVPSASAASVSTASATTGASSPNPFAATSSATSATTATVSTKAGPEAIPISAFAKWSTVPGPLTINHQGQFPVVTVSFNLAPGVSLSQAVDAISATLADLNPPPSLQTQFQGATAAFQNSLSSEPILLLAAIITVYIVLGVLYESFIHPITILSTLPSAGVGALLALEITHTDLNVISIIGIILLIGIVKKNAIMMVDFALDAQRLQGLSPRDAIYQAAQLRFRPILMTTMAALLGALPLAMGTGVGSELRKPLGISIIGGLILSQILTLYTTPVIYLMFERISEFFSPAPVRIEKPTETV